MKIDPLRLYLALSTNIYRILGSSTGLDLENMSGVKLTPLYTPQGDTSFTINDTDTFDYDLSTTSGLVKVAAPYLITLSDLKCFNRNHIKGIIVDSLTNPSFGLLDINRCDCYKIVGFIDDETMKKLGTLLLNGIKKDIKNNWLLVRGQIVGASFFDRGDSTVQDQQIITTFNKILNVDFDILDIDVLRNILSQLGEVANAAPNELKEHLLEVASGVDEVLSTMYLQTMMFFSIFYAVINSLPLVRLKCAEPSSYRFPNSIGIIDHRITDTDSRNRALEYVKKRFFDDKLVLTADKGFVKPCNEKGIDPNLIATLVPISFDPGGVVENMVLNDSWNYIAGFLISNKLPVWPGPDKECNNCEKCPPGYTICTPELCVSECCGGTIMVRNTSFVPGQTGGDDHVLNEEDECHCKCPKGYVWTDCDTNDCVLQTSLCEYLVKEDVLAEYEENKYGEVITDGHPGGAFPNKNGFCIKADKLTTRAKLDCGNNRCNRSLATGVFEEYETNPEKYSLIDWYVKQGAIPEKSRDLGLTYLSLPACPEGMLRLPPDCECRLRASGSYSTEDPLDPSQTEGVYLEPELPPGWILFDGKAIQMG